MSHGWILILMSGLFLGLGYLGVPVAFSLTAGVLVATMLTPISLPSIIGQLFNGWINGFESAEPAHEEIHVL